MTNRIWFVESTSLHNNFGIMAEGEAKVIKRINRIIQRDCTSNWFNDPDYDEKKSWGSFHQWSSNDWTYWEFWAEQTVEFRAKVVAKIEAIKAELVTPDEWDIDDCDGCTELQGDQECAACRKFKASQVKVDS